MASFNATQLSSLLKKMENQEEILSVLRAMAFIRIPSDVAKELKVVKILQPLMAQEDLKGPVKMVLAKLEFEEKKTAGTATPAVEKVTGKKEKTESRKRKADKTSEESKAPKKRKSTEQKETVVPKKKETKPKKQQPTALMRKCLKQAKGMFTW